MTAEQLSLAKSLVILDEERQDQPKCLLPAQNHHFPLLLLLLLSRFSCVRLCATPEMAAHQAPPSLGFSRQEHFQGFLPQPGKDLDRPSSTRLEARVPSHGSGAMTRSPSPLAWRPDFPGAPREAH